MGYSVVFSEERQEELNGMDVQIGLGDKAQFHRVRVEFVQNTADHPQIHANTGILNNACHVCLSKHPSDFRPSSKNRDGEGESELRLSTERPITTI